MILDLEEILVLGSSYALPNFPAAGATSRIGGMMLTEGNRHPGGNAVLMSILKANKSKNVYKCISQYTNYISVTKINHEQGNA
jgi:hypothetical protein